MRLKYSDVCSAVTKYCVCHTSLCMPPTEFNHFLSYDSYYHPVQTLKIVNQLEGLSLLLHRMLDLMLVIASFDSSCCGSSSLIHPIYSIYEQIIYNNDYWCQPLFRFISFTHSPSINFFFSVYTLMASSSSPLTISSGTSQYKSLV
jgi:hypothetical protein